MPQPKPFSAADPDLDGYNHAMDREQANRRRREEREHRARSIAETAGQTREVLGVAEATPRIVGEIGADPAASGVARRIGRVATPAGSALNAAEGAAGYRADRAAGMPKDEAALKNGGRTAGAELDSATGAAAGARIGKTFGPRGAVIGAAIGSILPYKLMESIGENTGEFWHNTKEGNRQLRQMINKHINAINDPANWVRPRDWDSY